MLTRRTWHCFVSTKLKSIAIHRTQVIWYKPACHGHHFGQYTLEKVYLWHADFNRFRHVSDYPWKKKRKRENRARKKGREQIILVYFRTQKVKKTKRKIKTKYEENQLKRGSLTCLHITKQIPCLKTSLVGWENEGANGDRKQRGVWPIPHF